MSEALPAEHVPVDTKHGDDVDVRAIVLWGFVAVVVTIMCVLGLHAMYNAYLSEQVVEKSYQIGYDSAAEEINKQRSSLVAAPDWVNKDEGIVRIPIDRAMELTVEEYRKSTE